MKTSSAISRRRFLHLVGAAAVLPRALRAESVAWPGIGISIFGANTWEEGLRESASIGYKNVEIYAGPGPTDPAILRSSERREFRRMLNTLGLKISGLSIHTTSVLDDGPALAQNLDRLKAAAQMGHDLDPGAPPPLQIQSNGVSDEWGPKRAKLLDRFGLFADTAATTGATLAVKAHAGNAVDTPQKLLWILRHVRHGALSANYDFSHFEFTGISLADSLAMLLPYTTFLQVKDARMGGGKREFLLPGEGDIDYAEYFRLLRRHNYAGPVVVEISARVRIRTGFDFKTCARSSFAAVESGRRRA